MLVLKIFIFFICLLSFGCGKGDKKGNTNLGQPKAAKEEGKPKTGAKTLPKVVAKGKPKEVTKTPPKVAAAAKLKMAAKGGELPATVKSTVAPRTPPKVVAEGKAKTIAETPPKAATKDKDKVVRSDTEETFDFCRFPASLKKAVETKLNMNCSAVTSDRLTQIKQMVIKNVAEEEAKLLTEKYASYFSALEDLDMSGNPHLLSLPSFVTHISVLKKLNVSRTGISSFSEDICKLKQLEVLIASHNKYKGQEVPREIFCLSTLKVVDMSRSSIRYIDEYIGHLSQLEELYMSGNLLLLIPQMLSTLPHLTLVDFRNNNLKNEDLNNLQSCKSLKGEEKKDCQDDLSDSIECEAVHELPFQRGEPLRQMYINLAIQKSQELMKQCEEDKKYCPHFIMKCRDYPEYDKEQCMLDDFESTRTEYKYHPHRDACYITWASWLVDYEKYPALLNKTIRGKTIREMRYISKNQSVLSCWEWPWENIRALYGLIDFAPEKHDANPFEVFPKLFRKPGFASHVKSWTEAERGTFNTDTFWWVPKDCPHLPSDLKGQIKKIAKDQGNEGA